MLPTVSLPSCRSSCPERDQLRLTFSFLFCPQTAPPVSRLDGGRLSIPVQDAASYKPYLPAAGLLPKRKMSHHDKQFPPLAPGPPRTFARQSAMAVSRPKKNSTACLPCKSAKRKVSGHQMKDASPRGRASTAAAKVIEMEC